MPYHNSKRSVDRRFYETRKRIALQSPAFLEYLRIFVLNTKSFNLLQKIATQTDVYVFSGVIRNYLLGESTSKDFDIVVRGPISPMINNILSNDVIINRNSFGGYKLCVDDLNIDLWSIENTWSLLKQPELRSTPYTLVKTVFFNFSAIVFDVNNLRFIYDDSFLSFYEFRVMDVVNEDNPNPGLCIVNTMYYAIKYALPIKYRLCRWIVEHYTSMMNFEYIQLRHFGYQVFTRGQIFHFFKVCKTVLSSLRKNLDHLCLALFNII